MPFSLRAADWSMVAELSIAPDYQLIFSSDGAVPARSISVSTRRPDELMISIAYGGGIIAAPVRMTLDDRVPYSLPVQFEDAGLRDRALLTFY